MCHACSQIRQPKQFLWPSPVGVGPGKTFSHRLWVGTEWTVKGDTVCYLVSTAAPQTAESLVHPSLFFWGRLPAGWLSESTGELVSMHTLGPAPRIRFSKSGVGAEHPPFLTSSQVMGGSQSWASLWGPLPQLLWGEGGRLDSCPRTVSRLPAAAPATLRALRSSANTPESEWKETLSLWPETGISGPCPSRCLVSVTQTCVLLGHCWTLSGLCFKEAFCLMFHSAFGIRVAAEGGCHSRSCPTHLASRSINRARRPPVLRHKERAWRRRGMWVSGADQSGLSHDLSLHSLVVLRSHFRPFKSSTFSSYTGWS